MRSLRAWVLSLAKTARYSLPTLAESMILPVDRDRIDHRIENWAKDCLDLAEVNLEVEGLDNIDRRRNYVVLSNHQSTYDIFALFRAFPMSLRMAAKKEIFDIPIFGRVLRYGEFILVDRASSQNARLAVDMARSKIESGISVWMAPEGTRSLDGRLGPFKKGGFILAIETQTPILPVTLVDTHLALPAGSFIPQTGSTMRVVFHRPIDTSGMTFEDRNVLLQKTRSAIESTPSRTDT